MVVPPNIKIELSNYPSIPLLGIYPKVLKAGSQRDVLFILSLHLRCFISLYSFLGMILAFSDRSGSTSSLFHTHCISSTVSASGLQHKPAHLCPLAALSQVEEWVRKHTGDEGPHWQHVHGGAKVSSMDPAGGEDGFSEERSL